MTSFLSKAPGRICLFGDHQDYLELPIIACAINRYIQVNGTPNEANHFTIKMPDMGTERTIPLTDTHTVFEKGDHLRASLNVVRRYGCQINQGYDLVIHGDVPINAGLSSSSAMTVAWVRWLLHTFGCHQEISPEFIGRLAYEAEVIEQDSPGGKMDQYTSAIGDVIYLETDERSSIQKLRTQLEGLTIGESGIPKNTVGLLGDLKTNALKALRLIKGQDEQFDLAKADLSDYKTYVSVLPSVLQPYFYAAIQNHLITQKALIALREEKLNYHYIGQLMNEHHTVLKEVLHITVPRIDRMIEAALEAGAYGAKIVGSGGGGSIVALSPLGKSTVICDAIKNAGAIAAYPVQVSKGVHIL